MKKFLITAFTLLISLCVMAQATNVRTLRLYYGGEVIFSRLVSQLDSLNFKVNAVEDDEEDKPVVPDITTCDKNYSESGLYLGVIGFNNKLTEKELGLLTPSTVNSYKTFVNNLSVGNATVLYYAEENGLDRLTQASFPSDLISASIVTFTDGLDQGSVAYNEYYENMGIAQYLTDLNGRILSEKVCGSNIKIDAYAIGLQGKDVQDVEAFKNNLRKLSSSEDKMFEANDMDEVNETFNNIARSLYSATSIFSMTFNIPMPSNGEVVRFTFDNVEKAEDSKCYIEGTYRSRNLEDLKFEGCLYQGPAVISGVKSGVEMSFSFEGLSDMNNEQLPRTNIQNFKKSSVNGIWQLNSEFDGNSNVEIEEEQKTAVVMLVLDCSSSLGDDFARMKSAANNFISLLLNASEQNNTVSFDANGGTGSMSSMTFGKGDTKNLTANKFTRTGYTFVGWNTKADGTGTSYSDKQSITPTENLTLYAQWEESKGTGTANGHDWVDLGLPSGTKWATMNLGATSPEGYGNYYAWGETTTKSSYTLDNYKWYDNVNKRYTKYIIETQPGTGAKGNYYIAGEGVEGSGFACDFKWDPAGCPLVNGTITFPNLPAGEYQFKITDGTWNYSWGSDCLANKDDFFDQMSWSNVAFTLSSESDVTISFDGESIFVFVSNITLLASDDAANANWGGDWRMPTNEEIDELVDNCTWTWISQNGVNGYKVSSKVNGNSIFLPAAGCSTDSVYFTGNGGYYWCSSLDTTGFADYLCIGSDSVLTNYRFDRYGGLSIRPVLP